MSTDAEQLYLARVKAEVARLTGHNTGSLTLRDIQPYYSCLVPWVECAQEFADEWGWKDGRVYRPAPAAPEAVHPPETADTVTG